MKSQRMFKKHRDKGRLVFKLDEQGEKIPIGWEARWTDTSGRVRTKRFARKLDADRHAAGQMTSVVRGDYVDPLAGRVTLGEFAESWMAQQSWRSSTRETAESHIRRHIGPAFGDRPLSSITQSDVQGFMSRLRFGGLAYSTREAIYVRLVSILNGAVDDQVLPRSPIRRPVDLGTEPRRNHLRVLTSDQVRSIAETVPPWLEALVWCGALTGMRSGELAGLTVEQIDWERRMIHVDRQLVTVKGQGPTLGALKTVDSDRQLPMTDELAEILRRHLEQFPSLEVGPGATLVFTNRDRAPLRRNVLGDAWSKARSELGISSDVATGWHALRHFYATLLLENGRSIKVVQRRLGHRTHTETMETYSHLLDDADDADREALRLDDTDRAALRLVVDNTEHLGATRGA